jgi:membrane protein YdbS with pleckstrin-like domain
MVPKKQYAHVARVQRCVRACAVFMFIAGVSTILYACGAFSGLYTWLLNIVRVLVGLCGVLAVVATPYLLVYAKWYRPGCHKKNTPNARDIKKGAT